MTLQSLIYYSTYVRRSSRRQADGKLCLEGWDELVAAVRALPRAPFDSASPETGQVIAATTWYPERRVLGVLDGVTYTDCLGADGCPITLGS